MSDESKKNRPPGHDPDQEIHVYDGIEEHDNLLPRWWLGILYGTTLFAAGYAAHYMLGPGPTLVQEYEAESRVIEHQRLAENANRKAPTEEELLALVKSPERALAGKQAFGARCVACHGPQGQGGIGPNLTDNFWLHGGGKLTGVVKTITDGVSDKGMPPWGPLMSPDDIVSLAAYIRSLHGTNPPNAKAPQGDKAAE